MKQRQNKIRKSIVKSIFNWN